MLSVSTLLIPPNNTVRGCPRGYRLGLALLLQEHHLGLVPLVRRHQQRHRPQLGRVSFIRFLIFFSSDGSIRVLLEVLAQAPVSQVPLLRDLDGQVGQLRHLQQRVPHLLGPTAHQLADVYAFSSHLFGPFSPEVEGLRVRVPDNSQQQMILM